MRDDNRWRWLNPDGTGKEMPESYVPVLLAYRIASTGLEAIAEAKVGTPDAGNWRWPDTDGDDADLSHTVPIAWRPMPKFPTPKVVPNE